MAEETLAIAIYCALKYSDDFVKGVAAAVNHDGDSDSTGAVTGNILGTVLGFEAIPQKYLDKLELKDVMFLNIRLFSTKHKTPLIGKIGLLFTTLCFAVFTYWAFLTPENGMPPVLCK